MVWVSLALYYYEFENKISEIKASGKPADDILVGKFVVRLTTKNPLTF